MSRPYDPEYRRNHEQVRRARGKASAHKCIDCGEQAKEWSQVHRTIGDDPKHYEPRCHRCHQKYDDRWNDDERARVAASVKKVWENNPERRAEMSARPHATGHTVSEEARKRIGASKVGNRFAAGKRTPEQCERIRIARWGR